MIRIRPLFFARIRESVSVSGYVVREEQVLSNESSGLLQLLREEGERVSAGGTVAAVFAEPQYPESAADIIASESGIRVWTLDPVTTGPNDKDAYLNAMEQNMETLVQALS